MSALGAAFTVAVVFGLLAVLAAGEVLRAGALAPRSRRVLDRVAIPMLVVFCLIVGRQIVQFV
jgi:hypothetical protein